MRQLLVVILLFLTFLPSLGKAGENLPLLSPVKDLRYLEGDPKLRQDFYEERLRLLKKLEREIELLNQKTKEKRLKRQLDEALLSLKELPSIWQKLRSPRTPLSVYLPAIPDPGSPPYKVKTFINLLDVGFQLETQLKTLGDKISLKEAQVKRLSEALDRIYADYLAAREKGPSIKTYVLLAEVLTLQARWALSKAELLQAEELERSLLVRKKSFKTTVSRVFTALKVTSQDIVQAERAVSQSQKESEALLRQTNARRQDLEKELALIEVRLVKLGEAPRGSKTGLSWRQKRWETRKERLELTLEVLAEQERLVRISFERARFWRDWLVCFKQCSRRETLAKLRKMKAFQRNLRDSKRELRQRLSYLSQQLLLVQSAISLHREEERRYLGRPQGGEVARLLREEKALEKVLDDLNHLLTQEAKHLERLIYECGVLIDLWETRVGPWGRFLEGVKETYLHSQDTLKRVLYYPLFSVGQMTFTLAGAFKFFFILSLGIGVLRFFRRRLERFLVYRLRLASGLVNSLSTLSYYSLLVILVIVALSSVGVNMNQVGLIFGALGVGIGFGLQTIANNFISGIILLTERSLSVGDIVELEDGTLGQVKQITIRSTVIRTFDGLDLIVPNSEFISGRVATWTYGDDWRRLHIPFGVAYGSDPEKVREVASSAARSVPLTVEDDHHPIRVWFKGFGDSSLDFDLVVWIRLYHARPLTGMISDYYYALYRALSEAGIEIPFPQRDLHLRSVDSQILEKIKKQTPDEGESEQL